MLFDLKLVLNNVFSLLKRAIIKMRNHAHKMNTFMDALDAYLVAQIKRLYNFGMKSFWIQVKIQMSFCSELRQ